MEMRAPTSGIMAMGENNVNILQLQPLQRRFSALDDARNLSLALSHYPQLKDSLFSGQSLRVRTRLGSPVDLGWHDDIAAEEIKILECVSPEKRVSNCLDNYGNGNNISISELPFA